MARRVEHERFHRCERGALECDLPRVRSLAPAVDGAELRRRLRGPGRIRRCAGSGTLFPRHFRPIVPRRYRRGPAPEKRDADDPYVVWPAGARFARVRPRGEIERGAFLQALAPTLDLPGAVGRDDIFGQEPVSPFTPHNVDADQP